MSNPIVPYAEKSMLVKEIQKPTKGNDGKAGYWCAHCIRRVSRIRKLVAFELDGGRVVITSCLDCHHIISVDVIRESENDADSNVELYQKSPAHQGVQGSD